MTTVNSLLTSSNFKRFLDYNGIKDNPIPEAYPQLQEKIEAYNKIYQIAYVF